MIGYTPLDLPCGCMMAIDWHHQVPYAYWSASAMEEFANHLKSAIIGGMNANIDITWRHLLIDRNTFSHFPVNEFGHRHTRILFQILIQEYNLNVDGWDLCMRRGINGRGIVSPMLNEVWLHASKWQIHDPAAPRSAILSMIDSEIWRRDFHYHG